MVFLKVNHISFKSNEGDQPHPQQGRGRELSKIYDSLLETPSPRTPPTASSGSGSISRNLYTLRTEKGFFPKYSVQKRECC